MIASDRIIKPGSVIGILGGGQLGKMIALAGKNMGYRFLTLDPNEDAASAQVADQHIRASFDCLDSCELISKVDVITYEFENIEAAAVARLAQKNYLPQGSHLLYTAQHRLREKEAVENAGCQVAPYAKIDSLTSFKNRLLEFGFPCVLKTASGGYDGKGQFVIQSSLEINEAYQTLLSSKTDLVLEKFIPFEKELSIIVARRSNGEMKTFPVAENIHLDNILHQSIVPARILPEIEMSAKILGMQIAESLNVIGLLAIEFFLLEGKLLVNELAPRPHNSGHYTMEACLTSQFEQHIRAICNLPLGLPNLTSKVVMVNILGEHLGQVLDKIDEIGFLENEELGVSAKVHLYGKAEVKPKRKMGHINLLCNEVDKAFLWIEKTGIWQ